jgi:hypothetical protein
MNFTEEFNQKFEETVRKDLRFYNKDQIKWVKLPEHSVMCLKVFTYGEDSIVATVEEYCDWFDVQREDNLREIAVRLGHMCASAYNALVGNAMRKYGVGVCITDLFENNIKATVVYPDTPMCDPVVIGHGWAAWRFKFAAASAASAVRGK